MKSFEEFCGETNIIPAGVRLSFAEWMEILASYRDYCDCHEAPGDRERTATSCESQDTTARVVRMPLRELIDSLSLLNALKSDHERWVEIVNFPEYGTFSVEFLSKGKEPDSASVSEQGEAGGVIDARPWHLGAQLLELVIKRERIWGGELSHSKHEFFLPARYWECENPHCTCAMICKSLFFFRAFSTSRCFAGKNDVW